MTNTFIDVGGRLSCETGGQGLGMGMGMGGILPRGGDSAELGASASARDRVPAFWAICLPCSSEAS